MIDNNRVCDECKHGRMNPNSVNDQDWCIKHNKFVWPLEAACEDFESDSRGEAQP